LWSSLYNEIISRGWVRFCEVIVRSGLLRVASRLPLINPLDPSAHLLFGQRGRARLPPPGEVIGLSTLRDMGPSQLYRLLGWPHSSWHSSACPIACPWWLNCPARCRQLLALPHSLASASCTSPLLSVSLLALPRFSASAFLHYPTSSRGLRIVPSAIQFCFQRHCLRPPLSPV